MFNNRLTKRRIILLLAFHSSLQKLLSLILTSAILVVLGGCGRINSENNSNHSANTWPSVLEEAQKKAFEVDPDAVIDTVRATTTDNKEPNTFNFDFVFLLPSGKELTINYTSISGFQVNAASGVQLQKPSSEELQIRKQIIDKDIIGPQEALDNGKSFVEEIERTGPLTLPISPILVVGSFVEKDYGVQAVWTYDIVNSQERGVIAMDATTGDIIRQEVFSR